jgi:hypothetical protein
MKIKMFNIDFSDFTEGKEIENIEYQDYSVSSLPYAYVAIYYPIIKDLTIFKVTEDTVSTLTVGSVDSIPMAAFYPLIQTEDENN